MQNEANPAAPAICRPDVPFVGAVIGRPPEAAGDGGRQSAVPTGGIPAPAVAAHIKCATVPAPALAAIQRLREVGYAAYLVGGCVRDALLGREPGDWDITTAALPEQVEAVFAGERIIETGLKHGTVTVLLDGTPLEITTFRTESGYADHRHPDAVAFTPSLEEDLARRDFTINAMAWCPEGPLIRPSVRTGAPSPQGEGFDGGVDGGGLVDPFGGKADLEAHLIRCVGDPCQRFGEDALRILRALRFAAQLGFSIDADTAAAAYELRDTLNLVSRERIAVELTKLLCGPDARRVLTEYREILAVPLPELAPMAGLDQRSKYHCYDVLEHSAAAVEAVPPEKILRWAALLHDVGKPACFTLDEAGCGHFYGHAKVSAPMAREILTRLRFDRDTVNRVTALVELHDYPIDPPVEAGMHNEATGNRQQATAESASVGAVIGRPHEAAAFNKATGNGQQATEESASVGAGMQNAKCRMQNEAAGSGQQATEESASVGAVIGRPHEAAAFNKATGNRQQATEESASVGAVIGRPHEAAAERAIRKLIGKLGEADFFRLLDLKRADSLAHHPDYRGRTAACDRLEALARELLAQPPCFTVKDLAVGGNDLLALGFPRGPELGQALNALLEAVLSGELPNEKAALLEAAGKIKHENTRS